MGLRAVLLFPVLLALLFLSLGCGIFGGSADASQAGEMGLIDFGDDPGSDEPGTAVVSDEVVAEPLHVDPLVMIEIRFLYLFQVRLERLRGIIRDLNAAAEGSSPLDFDLDWVKEVHDITREADAFFKSLTSLEVPEPLRGQYRYLQIGMLETVQVAGYGADRLLRASVVVGPSGRSAVNMNRDEADLFEALLRESRFFLSESRARIDREVAGVGRAVGGLELR